MRLKKIKTVSCLKSAMFLVFMVFSCLYIGFRNVNAAVNVLPWPSPTVAPTPRQPGLQPISVARPSRLMWIAQGEIQFYENAYVCRVRCERSWLGFDLDVLQATRGTEDWLSFEEVRVRCLEEGEGTAKWYLHAGRWPTGSHSPEESLCFVVLSDSRHVP